MACSNTITGKLRENTEIQISEPYGILPFSVTDDLSAPNEAYFVRCDRMMSLAQKHGLLVILDPAETIQNP